MLCWACRWVHSRGGRWYLVEPSSAIEQRNLKDRLEVVVVVSDLLCLTRSHWEVQVQDFVLNWADSADD